MAQKSSISFEVKGNRIKLGKSFDLMIFTVCFMINLTQFDVLNDGKTLFLEANSITT